MSSYLMLKNAMKEFSEYFELDKSISESKLFAKFVNYTILKSYQPNVVSDLSGNILDLVDVDGSNDMGIDAIAIAVNGELITSIEQIKSIIKEQSGLGITFILIQSKCSKKIDAGEFGKFADGVEDYFDNEHNEPHNEEIESWIKIKEYIYEETLGKWERSPKIQLFYASATDSDDTEHITGKAKNLEKNLKAKKCDDCEIIFLNAKKLFKLYQESKNEFQVEIEVKDSFQIDEAEGVIESQVILCRAKNFVENVMISEDGNKRKLLFEDNVRDFQGETRVNKEILETLTKQPKHFALMNNGVTITCSELRSSNRKINITNPRIVNGC